MEASDGPRSDPADPHGPVRSSSPTTAPDGRPKPWQRLRDWLRATFRKAPKTAATIAALAGTATIGAIVNSVVEGGIRSLWSGSNPAYHVSVTTDPDALLVNGTRIGGAYLIPKPIDEVPAPPGDNRGCAGRFEWATELGGIGVSNRVRIVVQDGSTNHQVDVVGLQIKVLDRQTPLLGSVITCPPTGGSTDVLLVEAHLDEDPPAQTLHDPAGQLDTTQPLNGSVPDGESLLFDVLPRSNDYHVEWVAELTLVVDGKHVTETVDNNGRPFVTASSKNATTWIWDNGQWVDYDEFIAGQGQTAPADPPEGDSNAPPQSRQLARLNPCTLVTLDEAQAALGVELVEDPNAYNEPAPPTTAEVGLATTVQSVSCHHYLPDLSDVLVTITFQSAADASLAAAELAAQKASAAAPDRALTDLAGVGEEAFVTAQTGLARHANELLWIGVTSHQGETEGDRVAERLLRTAADRAW